MRCAGVLEVPVLEGTCNQCGLCCTSLDGFRCEHLELVGNLGQPEATRCRVYGERVDGMAIRMVRRKTGEERASRCWQGSPGETLAIVLRGLGKGCSLVPAGVPAGRIVAAGPLR